MQFHQKKSWFNIAEESKKTSKHVQACPNAAGVALWVALQHCAFPAQLMYVIKLGSTESGFQLKKS